MTLVKIGKILLFLFIIFIIISGVIYVDRDRQLFYYGENDFDIYDSLLPMNMKPVARYEFEGGFVLEDGYGFYHLSKGIHKYFHSNIEFNVKEIACYYFNKEKFIAQIVDIDESIYYIEYFPNDSNLIKQDMIINVWGNDSILSTGEFQCINLIGNEEQIDRIKQERNIFPISLIALMMIGIVIIVMKYLKSKI